MDDAARVRELDREADVDERAQQRARDTRAVLASLAQPRETSSAAASRFIVKYGRPSASVPSSCTGTIAGCSSRAWIRASRRNRVAVGPRRLRPVHPLDRDLAADLGSGRREHLAHAAHAEPREALVALVVGDDRALLPRRAEVVVDGVVGAMSVSGSERGVPRGGVSVTRRADH